MKSENKNVGKLGEQLAQQLLTDKGYQIIERNFGTKFGEIDLIAKDRGIWVFVEVKTKKGLDFGSPEEMFTKGKMQRVKRMAAIYLQGQETKCRIDMVAVVLDSQNQSERVTHYPNVIMW